MQVKTGIKAGTTPFNPIIDAGATRPADQPPGGSGG